MAPKLSLWQSEIVNLIPHIDDIELPKLMLQSLAKLVTFSNATFIINHFGTKPICIYDTYSDEDSRSWIKHYVNGTNPIGLVLNVTEANIF